MSDRINHQDISESLDRRLSGLQGDPWLATKVLAKAEGEKPVKKLSFATILVIVLLVLTMAGALAAALNAWGVVDFAGNTSWTYVPENARDSVTAEDVTVETDHLICKIQDSYYDGEYLRLTASVEPKEKMYLVVEDVDLQLTDEEGGMTVAERVQKEFGGRMAEIWLFPVNEGGEGDSRINEDGTVTVYTAIQFNEELPERDVELELGFIPVKNLAGLTAEQMEEGDIFDSDAVERTPVPLKVHAVKSEKYVCEEPLDFPETGVQVTRVEMRVTPWEIAYRLYYTVTDLDKYQAQNDGLWFEFVDPAKITAANYFEQTFEGGMSGGGSIGRVDIADESAEAEDGADGDDEFVEPEVEVGAVFCQTDTLGLNALGEEYTIRAYNCWAKDRYESVTFKVKKVE